VVARIFITGVSPLSQDSLTSGFNIAIDLSYDPSFHNLLGFTKAEVISLLQLVGVPKQEVPVVLHDLQQWYNGYLFHPNGAERLFNPNMVLYFSQYYQRHGTYPENLLDTNVASDHGKLSHLFKLVSNEAVRRDVFEDLVFKGSVLGTRTVQFSFERGFTDNDLISLLFYMGFITIKEGRFESQLYQVPNYVIEQLYFDYYRQWLVAPKEENNQARRLTEAIYELALGNNPEPLLQQVSSTLELHSNRDAIHLSEKHVKTVLLTLLRLTTIFTVYSEYPVGRSYADLYLLPRKPFDLPYAFLIELKYLKQSESDKKADILEHGMAQLQAYLSSHDWPYPTKAWLFVFQGPELAECVEVHTKQKQ